MELKVFKDLNLKNKNLKFIKEKMIQVEKNLNDMSYHAFELEQLYLVGIRQKEADQEERRKLFDDLEKITMILEETV